MTPGGALASGGIHMIIASTIASQSSVPDLRFKAAGWASFLGVFLVIPAIVTAILADKIPPVVLIYVPIIVVGNACAIYVLIQFKRLLNERCDFHGVDGIIIALIVISLVFASIDAIIMVVTTLIIPSAKVGSTGIAIFIMLLVVLGILGIIMGARLLAVQENVSGLLRPFAILAIISSSCQTTIILLPITCLLLIPCSVIMGMMLLRAANAEPQVEFV